MVGLVGFLLSPGGIGKASTACTNCFARVCSILYRWHHNGRQWSCFTCVFCILANSDQLETMHYTIYTLNAGVPQIPLFILDYREHSWTWLLTFLLSTRYEKSFILCCRVLTQFIGLGAWTVLLMKALLTGSVGMIALQIYVGLSSSKDCNSYLWQWLSLH